MAKGTVNKVIIIGRLGDDPELRFTQSQQPVANMRVATSEAHKDKSGNKQESTEWHSVILWGKQAEAANEYLKKGSRVYIEGRLQTRKWEDSSGVTRYSTEIVARECQFMDSTKGNHTNEPAPQNQHENDLPF